MPAPSVILDLVERFHRKKDVHKQSDYKEAEVRAEFIDPFLEALGWDVRNEQGYAEQYKDVVHEAALKTLYQRQIDATDRQIDTLVYELYGLTEAEIAIVESGG